MDFIVSKVDPSMFILHTSQVEIFILIYVNDILVSDSSQLAIDALVSRLQSVLPIKNLGHMHLFLTIQAQF